jgi:hypothetical protein
MTTHIISYDVAINEAINHLKGTYPEVADKAKTLLRQQIRRKLESTAEAELDRVIDEQSLSDQHKKQYQSSFRVTVYEDSLRLDFNPVVPLINAIENGVEEKSTEEMLLAKNYKISLEGYRYKVIPLQSKDPIPGAVGFQLREIKAGAFNEEQFFQSLVALVGGKERDVPFEINQVRGDVFDYRSAPIRVRVGTKVKDQRIYLSKSRNRIVNTVDRYTVFRTISERPGSVKWKSHKGFPGLKLASYLSTMYHEFITSYAEALINKVVS